MKGILFSDTMAQAIHAGTKTVTRRLIRGHNIRWEDGVLQHDVEDGNYAVPIPFHPGQIVYVKECWTVIPTNMRATYHQVLYRAGGDSKELKGDDLYGEGIHVAIASDAADYPCEKYGTWQSSMFMPEWAARTKLRILDVRPERLQAMTCGEAFLEGIEDSDYKPHQAEWQVMGKHAFVELWNSLNRKPGTRWEDNPWVWRIQFEKIAGLPLREKSQAVTDAKTSVASAESSVQNNPGENNDHTR